MASANQKKATFMSQKLKFLKDERDNLINAVGQYVSGLITAGESWTEGGDNKLEYIELCHMIDDAVVFLCEKCEELTGGSMGVTANQQSHAITATASTSATSNIQPAVLVQPADETQLKPVLARIAVIEEALCSFRNTAEKVAEQQSGIDQQLKELLSTLSESDKKHSSRFRKVKEQISEISDVQDAINEEHRTRLQSLERQLQKVSTAQDRLDKEVELQAELAEKLVHLPNQLEAVKENVDVLEARVERIVDECSIKHENIKNLTDDLVNKVMANTHTIQVISKDQDQKMTTLTDLETRLETIEADGKGNMKDFQKQAEKVEANLSQVIQEVAVMSPRLQQLELKTSEPGFGFSAWAYFGDRVARVTVAHYTTIYSTVGNSFDAESGIFTAPFDGLYVSSVSRTIDHNKEVRVYVRCQQQEENICWCPSDEKDTTARRVGVVHLKVGDKLFVIMDEIEFRDDSCHSPKCEFTCFLVR